MASVSFAAIRLQGAGMISYFQVFGIGFSFGLAGPCLFACAPVLLTYLAGKKSNWRQALIDIVIFLNGRLLAYLILGYLAGLSGVVLQQFSKSAPLTFVKPLAGLMIIFLGIYVWLGKEHKIWLCNYRVNRVFGFSGLLILGFIMGILPCAPLMALLLEIALISKTALHGLSYALFFGLGTFASGVIVIGGLSGVFSWLPEKVFKSKTSSLIFRTICALLLIFLGLELIFKFYPYHVYKSK